MNKQKTLKDFPEWFKPFDIGFDILDLVDILKYYYVPMKTVRACIKFYSGKSVGRSRD